MVGGLLLVLARTKFIALYSEISDREFSGYELISHGQMLFSKRINSDYLYSAIFTNVLYDGGFNFHFFNMSFIKLQLNE